MPFKYEKGLNHKTNINNTVYISNIDNKTFDINKINDENIKQYLWKTQPMHTIYTMDGIFSINSSKTQIKRITVIDNDIINETLHHNGRSYSILIDPSIESQEEIAYTIPFHYISVHEIKYIYKLNEKSPVEMVIIKSTDDTIKDMYFKLYDNLEHEFMKDILFSLLLKIN